MLEGALPRFASATRAARPALGDGGLRQLAAALLVAALAETLLLRVVVRVGVHVPKEAPLTPAFEAASFLGSLAFNFASLLAVLIAVLVIASLLRLQSAPARALLAALTLAMLAGLLFSLITDAAAADALFGVAAALLVAFIALLAVTGRRIGAPAALALLLIAAAYLSYQYYVLSYLFYRIFDYAAVPPLSITVLRFGEILAVAAALAVFLAWGLPRRRAVGPAGLAAVAAVLLALTLAGLSPVSTMAILALWTTGLSLFLPFPVYLVALALFLFALVACWRSGGQAFWPAAGLLLVLLGGYMAEATYQHMLLLLGVAFLGGAVTLPSPEAST